MGSRWIWSKNGLGWGSAVFSCLLDPMVDVDLEPAAVILEAV